MHFYTRFVISLYYRPLRVACLKLLGVIFDDNFKFNTHIDFLLKQCSQRVYLLKLLRSQGMSSEHLHQVTSTNYITPSLCFACLGRISNY